MGKTERGIQTKVKQTPTATKNHFLTCWMTTGSTKTPTEAEHALGTFNPEIQNIYLHYKFFFLQMLYVSLPLSLSD
jgi:hypothetical protein